MALRPETLTQYRRRLNQRRDELASEVSRLDAQVRRVQDGDIPASSSDDLLAPDVAGDSVDLTASELDRSALADRAERDTEELKQIEAALAAMDNGTYGICAECGAEIPQTRLDAIPRATLCIRDQEAAEERRIRRDSSSGGALSRVGA